MLKRKVLQMQDSFYVAIPKQLCDLIGIGKGTVLGIEFEQNKIIIAPVTACQRGTDAANTAKEVSA